jgi:hypothetical protein
MTALPAVVTVADVLRSRRGWHGLQYRGCLVKFIDWQPAPDGTYHAVTTDDNEHWLKPETWLEDHNVRPEATTTR